MALLDLTRTPGRSALASDRFHSSISNAFGALAAWNDARRTRNVLSQLTNRELDDIGLIPGDISRIALRR